MEWYYYLLIIGCVGLLPFWLLLLNGLAYVFRAFYENGRAFLREWFSCCWDLTIRFGKILAGND